MFICRRLPWSWLTCLGLLTKSLAVRSQEEDLQHLNYLDTDPASAVEPTRNASCPLASETVQSRLDFELGLPAAANFNPYTSYFLSESEDCQHPVEKEVGRGALAKTYKADVTIFPVLNSQDPGQSKVTVVLSDEILLHPDLAMPLSVCGAAREGLTEESSRQQCFCQVKIRNLNHGKPLRRLVLEWPLETYHVIPDPVLTFLASTLESKLSASSSKKVSKARNIREMRLDMLRRLEDADQTYGWLCPAILDTFDKLYLLMMVIFFILLLLLAFRLRRRRRTWYPASQEVAFGGSGSGSESQALSVDGPDKLCRTWCLQMFAFLGFMITLQGVGIRFISNMQCLPVVIITTWAVGLLEISRMFQCFCQAQLVNAALTRGLYVEWSSSSFMSSGFSTLVDDVGAIVATAIICLIVMFCAAYYGYADGMMSTAAMALWPAGMGIAKCMAFLQETDMTLRKALMPASIPELFQLLRQDPAAMASFNARLEKARCKELRTMKMQTFLHHGRQGRNPVAASAHDEETGPEGSSYKLFRDMCWQGRVVSGLTGSRVVWLNPLILFLMMAMMSYISFLRFGIVLCTPPTLQDLKPAHGILSPNFTPGRMRYAWPQRGHSQMVTMAFEKSPTMELLPPAETHQLWSQSANGTNTNWTVKTTELRAFAKTYALTEIPVRIVPTTVVLRYGDFERCLWFSMLRPSVRGGTEIAVPTDRGSNGSCVQHASGNLSCQTLELQISFRQVMLTFPSPMDSEAHDLHAKEPIQTVCQPARNETCSRSCQFDPRCLFSHTTSFGCCFVWTDVTNTSACFAESKGVPWSSRLVSLANPAANTVPEVTGQARLRGRRGSSEAGYYYVPDQNQSGAWSSLQFKLQLQRESLKDHELELYNLGELSSAESGALLSFSYGEVPLRDALVTLDQMDGREEEDDIRLEPMDGPAGALHYRIMPVTHRFHLATSRLSRTMYVVPLVADHGMPYELDCEWKCLPPVKIDHHQMFFAKQCAEIEMARWYDLCDGPFPTRISQVEVDLLAPQTLALAAVQPSGKGFSSSSLGVTLHTNNFLTPELVSDGCHIGANGKSSDFLNKLALCAIFRSNCSNVDITLPNGTNKSFPLTCNGSLFDGLKAAVSTSAPRREVMEIALCAAENQRFVISGGAELLVRKANLHFLDFTHSDAKKGLGKHGMALARQLLQRRLKKWKRETAADVLFRVLEQGTDTMLQVMVDEMLRVDEFAFYPDVEPQEIFSDLGEREPLLKLVEMMDLGETAVSSKLFRAFKNHSILNFHNLCNAVLKSGLEKHGASFRHTLQELGKGQEFSPTQLRLEKPPGDLRSLSMVLATLQSLPVFAMGGLHIQSGEELHEVVHVLQKLPQDLQDLSLQEMTFGKGTFVDRNCTILPAMMNAIVAHARLRSISLEGMVPPHETCFNGQIADLGARTISLNLAGMNLDLDSFKMLQFWWNSMQLKALDLWGWDFRSKSQNELIAGSEVARITKTFRPQPTLSTLRFQCGLRVHFSECNCNEQLLIHLLQEMPNLDSLDYGMPAPLPGESSALEKLKDVDLCLSEHGAGKLAVAIFEHQRLRNISLSEDACKLVHYIQKPSSVIEVHLHPTLIWTGWDQSSVCFQGGIKEAYHWLAQVPLKLPKLELLNLTGCDLGADICNAIAQKLPHLRCIV